MDAYEQQLAEWKAKNGVTTPAGEDINPEDVMVADDAKRAGKDYCVHCAERFKIADMRLISRRDDPYIQFDEDGEHSGKPDYWIAVQHRCRACKPCFKEHYEEDNNDAPDTGADLQPRRT